jgi:hypothetical protein
VVRSMAECGLPIADDMIKDINRSLHIMSSSLPTRGYSSFNLYIQNFVLHLLLWCLGGMVEVMLRILLFKLRAVEAQSDKSMSISVLKDY